MKILGLIIIGVFCIESLVAQSLNTIFSIESRGGYSTNTYLHPFVNEWDSSDDGAFARITPSAQFFWGSQGFSAEGSAGYFYESIFDNRNSWNGAFGSARLHYRFTESLSAGVEASGSHMSSSFRKQTLSMLPNVTWSPTLFTRIQAKAGSSFREYSGLGESEVNSFSDRFDLAGIELEHWPSLRWRIQVSGYGMPGESLLDNHSAALSVRRLIQQKVGITLSVSMNRFTNSYTISPQTGGSPFGSGQTSIEDEIIEQTDHLLRSEVAVTFPIAGQLSGSGSVGTHTFWAANGEFRSDIAASVGIRYSIPGSAMLNQRRSAVEPEWENKPGEAVVVTVNYGGDGNLYLTGEFNDWGRPGVALSRQTQQRLAASVELEPGIYEYKVILIRDGEESWVELSDDTMTVSDGFGGVNGLIFIEE
ncbi:glycogen-binding domain-containing protein [Rhodohalobacter sp. 8-1]|uniref:glycogen-binding domain-containing protein n=1 Tax=Rhodohalobacter sp. 8-1 TaxID=3131972 RepID=UPI0030EC7D42